MSFDVIEQHKWFSQRVVGDSNEQHKWFSQRVVGETSQRVVGESNDKKLQRLSQLMCKADKGRFILINDGLDNVESWGKIRAFSGMTSMAN